MYSGPVIDAHHHLWDLSLGKHPWLLPGSAAEQVIGSLGGIRRDALVDDYLQATAGQNLQASVHIEALWEASGPLAETRWLDALDKTRGVASRYVVAAPLGTPDAVAVLEAHLASPRVTGVRAILSWHPGQPAKCFAARPGMALEAAWRRDAAFLARRGLSLDLMLYPYQVDEVLDLAAALPELQIIVNHCGSPVDRDIEGMQRWLRGLRRLASADNIAIKVSNIAGYDHAVSTEVYRATVLQCIDCFGVTRTLFGSDWPVAGLHCSLASMYSGFRVALNGFSDSEQSALFCGNAARLYRVEQIL